jgi:hypothetical protein
MNRKLKHVVLLATYSICSASVVFFSGCQQGMALDAGPKSMKLKQDSIGIFTLRTSNQFVESYQPKVTLVGVKSESEKPEVSYFKVERPYSKKKNDSFDYIISVRLPAGSYRLDGRVGSSLAYKPAGVQGVGGLWPVQGWFRFPIEAGFELPPDSIVYLGHVEMVNRKAKEGEPRSGGILPLIDQAASGFPKSTFDVTIADRSETDIPLIKKTYPFLEKRTITKTIMNK